jgi:hypothetical protein
MAEGKLNYEREQARKEVEAERRAARQIVEDSETLTGMLFLGCALSGKTPGEMHELWSECRAFAVKVTAGPESLAD